ncbi:hypothetical protein CKM354_001029900 [Cercospora kikuchii]|uniref:Uncharacterized protein n=1 Tax=Cercospora kikuchii TaxID=84275 RepID=A0A9P3CWQ3_9PEZI|nr:uncharacterized protein CKM354_001029900 [Cercospora kikuchii]GIZ47200.1 hypothetical protein CKM354_001029900 [Cercospora kikuchii]
MHVADYRNQLRRCLYGISDLEQLEHNLQNCVTSTTTTGCPSRPPDPPYTVTRPLPTLGDGGRGGQVVFRGESPQPPTETNPPNPPSPPPSDGMLCLGQFFPNGRGSGVDGADWVSYDPDDVCRRINLHTRPDSFDRNPPICAVPRDIGTNGIEFCGGDARFVDEGNQYPGEDCALAIRSGDTLYTDYQALEPELDGNPCSATGCGAGDGEVIGHALFRGLPQC